MSEPNLQPLAALLASHPEECAAVLCAIVMHGRDMVTPDDIASDLCVYSRGPHVSHDLIVRIGVALGIARIVKVSVEGVGEIEAVHRMAIARMGAAAWLRARCGVAPAMTRAQAIAIAETVEGPRCVWDSADMGALVRHLLLGDSLDHRPMLARMVAGGIKRAEREAAWAAERLAAAEGAQAPKGEQR